LDGPTRPPAPLSLVQRRANFGQLPGYLVQLVRYFPVPHLANRWFFATNVITPLGSSTDTFNAEEL
jgi:hypothetical protein